MFAVLIAGGLIAKDIRADEKKAPESFRFQKVGKMPPVTFPHALHGKLNACADCHGGKTPLFLQKFNDDLGMKMADIYTGKACGACHDGKDHGKNKAVFAAKSACMKCHKK